MFAYKYGTVNSRHQSALRRIKLVGVELNLGPSKAKENRTETAVRFSLDDASPPAKPADADFHSPQGSVAARKGVLPDQHLPAQGRAECRRALETHGEAPAGQGPTSDDTNGHLGGGAWLEGLPLQSCVRTLQTDMPSVLPEGSSHATSAPRPKCSHNTTSPASPSNSNNSTIGSTCTTPPTTSSNGGRSGGGGTAPIFQKEQQSVKESESSTAKTETTASRTLEQDFADTTPSTPQPQIRAPHGSAPLHLCVCFTFLYFGHLLHCALLLVSLDRQRNLFL